MRLALRHVFGLPRERVERALLHPGLCDWLGGTLDHLERIEEIERVETDAEVRRRLRIRPRIGLLPFARGHVRPAMTEYIEASSWVRAAHRLSYTIHPNLPPGWEDRFVGRGTYALVADGDRTHRTLETELQLLLPAVGRLAERFLATHLRATLEAEARALESFARTL